MKLFFIRSQESDYLQDSLYAGFCQKLGQENVFEYPWDFSKHLKTKVYPRNLNQLSHPSFWRDLRQRFDFNFLKEADLVVVASAKPETFKSYQQIQSQIPSSCPIIFLDGGDRPEIGGDLIRLNDPEIYGQVTKKRAFDFIFKREYLLGDSHPANVFPLPFAINPDLFSSVRNLSLPLIYDVTFWAVESDAVRSKALALIENLWDCRQNGTERNQSFKKYDRKGNNYLKALLQAKVTLNFRGVGWDTLRYWEVTGLGRFLLSQKPQIIIPENFRDGQEIAFCKDDLSDLVELCEYYLKNDSAREKIAAAAKAWSLAHHTAAKRAETVLKTCLGST
jgi:hypothetical protein